ncbi:MAG: GIY-YIG nuclease family protein [Salinivenus sp.]
MIDAEFACPRSKGGTYALLLRADTKQKIDVGALGAMTVHPGAYVYVGSAFGPGGVRARVERHARGDGAWHWHVDYLRAATTLARVWWTHDAERRECDWAAALRSLQGAAVPLRGFGASDCGCSAHLVYLDEEGAAAVPRALRAAVGDGPIRSAAGDVGAK